MSPPPQATTSTAHIRISILECGVLTIPDSVFHQNGPDEKLKLPVYAA